MHKNEILSQIDTDRFGLKIGKTDGEIFRKNPKVVLQKLISDGYKMIIARVNMTDLALINDMEDLGFRIKDSQVTYVNQLRDNQPFTTIKSDEFYSVREFITSDTDRLVRLAKDCFNNYGHYFANPHLDKQKCVEVYGDWAYNTCTNRDVADKIFVACHKEIPVGYLSFKVYEDSGKRYGVGGMGAIDTQHRGNNIFPSLILAGLEWGAELGLDWEEHNTLVTNFAVNRSMVKMGFKSTNHFLTMHLWVQD